ncbi:MAG: phosphatase PAP2 family protein [Elusimicrobiota bacterium]
MRSFFAALLLLSGLCTRPLPAQEVSSKTYVLKDGSSLAYARPAFWRTLGSGPADIGLFLKDSFKKKNLPWLAAVGASTLVLIEYDQKLYNNARRAGKKLRISSVDKTRAYLKLGGVPVFRGPSDLGSALYFLGDGWINIGLFGYFKTEGWLGGDWRASQTGNQLAEGLIATGLVTEVMKNITGRETPSAASAPRGVWRMFPGLKQYMAHRTRYDAFPSGHLATGVMTVTVIAGNYPDNKYVKPIGYTLLGGLCFQMMNNGVHWASDYPLGIAVGYGLGKAITSGGRTAAKRSGPAAPTALKLAPYLGPEGEPGAMLAYRF